MLWLSVTVMNWIWGMQGIFSTFMPLHLRYLFAFIEEMEDGKEQQLFVNQLHIF